MTFAVSMNSLKLLNGLLNRSKVVDLSVLIENGIPRWLTHPHLVVDQTVTHEHDGYYCQSISMAEHTGTHVDAPYHVHSDMPDKTIEHIDLNSLIGQATVIDLSDRDWKPGDRASKADIQNKLDQLGVEIEENDIVLLNFGWLKRYWTTTKEWKYYVENQPGLTEDAAEFFIKKKVKAVGTDTAAVGTPVIDGKSEHCFFHDRVLRKEIYLIECLVNLEQLPAKCLFFSAPLKIYRGSGSPIRAIAFVPQS